MLLLLSLFLALSGGAFPAPSFHGTAPVTGPAAPFAPTAFDGTSGMPDHGIPAPSPTPDSMVGAIRKVWAPVRNDGTSGMPDHP